MGYGSADRKSNRRVTDLRQACEPLPPLELEEPENSWLTSSIDTPTGASQPEKARPTGNERHDGVPG